LLKQIEVFKAGVYGENDNRIWSDDEVKQMQENYNYSYRRAAVKLGHDGLFDIEKPAVGWVESVYLNDNNILVAVVNFNDDDVKDIKDKYINASVEVTKSIETYDLNEQTIKGAYLLGVALLGSSQPEVAGLKPIKFSKDSDEKVVTNIMSDVSMKIEDFEKVNKNDTITKINKGEVMKPEVLKAEVEAFKKKNADLEAKIAKFTAEKRNSDIVAFFEANKEKITPVVKENLVEFSKTLNDNQLENFKKVIETLPKIEVVKELDLGKEPIAKEPLSAEAEALKDLEVFKKIK